LKDLVLLDGEPAVQLGNDYQEFFIGDGTKKVEQLNTTVQQARKLITPHTINGFLFDGTHPISYYAECGTAKTESTKVVNLPYC
jgi:hypothetical protein